MRLLRFAVIAAVAVFGVACSGSGNGGGNDGGNVNDGGGGTDGGSGTDGGNATDGGNGTDGGHGFCNASCNSVVPLGSLVEETQVAADAPAPTGGSPADGTYVLSSVTDYTGDGGASGPTGQSKQQTLVVSGTTVSMAELTHQPDAGCDVERQTISVVFNSTNKTVTATQTCPACDADGGGCGGVNGYSSDGTTTFKLYEQKSFGTREQVFTKH